MINKDRSDNIEEEFFNFKAVHGRAGISFLNERGFNHVPNISKDVHVVMITNFPFQNMLNKLYIDNPDKVKFTYIVLDTTNFRCGRDLIEPLLNHIKTVDEKYILYMDASDTALITDIDDPQAILDEYNCKILFNAEDGYSFPDHHCVDKTYLEIYAKYHNEPMYEYYGNRRNKIMDVNIKRLQDRSGCEPYRKSLNSGLFLGEKDYLIGCLTTMVRFMDDDPIRGYPYGETENQKLWQYLQSVCPNEEIQIDYLNSSFLWNHERKFSFPTDSWEHFNYFNKIKK